MSIPKIPVTNLDDAQQQRRAREIINLIADYLNGEQGFLKEQAFLLRIENTAGTLQHAICSEGAGVTLGNYSSRIIGASDVLANTPTGADASTAFVSGGKIGSASPFIFWFDTAAQIPAEAQLLTAIVGNSTGTALTARPQFSSIDINGVTRLRLAFVFQDAATGATFNLNTTNIASGKVIWIQFRGKLY